MDLRVLALATVIGSSAASVEAQAQIWIGQMAGEMVARQAAIAREKACRAGEPAPPKEVAKAETKIAQTMIDYQALGSASKPAALGKVFALKAEGLSWTGPEGAVPVADLGPHLDSSKPTLEPLRLVVGGDLETARGVWRATPTGADGKPSYYVIDFKSQPTAPYGVGWRIWHLSIAPGEPELPGAYCHFNPDQAR